MFYSRYRECLRWDFGFTCPFCLTHEADIVRGGLVARLGVMGIEHVIPQSADQGSRDDYSNCIYCCRLCNIARSNKPLENNGRRLLDPTIEAWANHFRRNVDSLEPQPGNADAEYTHSAYDIDSPEKLMLRKLRRLTIEDHRVFLKDAPKLVVELLERANDLKDSNPVATSELIRASATLRGRIIAAMRDLNEYAAIPSDAPKECRCDPAVPLTLPAELDAQLIELATGF